MFPFNTMHSFIHAIKLNKVSTKKKEIKSNLLLSSHAPFTQVLFQTAHCVLSSALGQNETPTERARLILRFRRGGLGRGPRAPNVPLRGASIVTLRRSGHSSFVSPYMVIYVTRLFRPPGFNEKKRWSSLGRATQ